MADQLDQTEYVQKQSVRINSFTLPYDVYQEFKQIRDMAGLNEKAALRFMIIQFILNIKQGQAKLYMSKEYMEKLFREEAIEMFDKIQEGLKNSVELENIE